MIEQLKKGIKIAQAISLDVVLGSGLMSLVIAKYYQVHLPAVVVLCLMIAVWIIYTYDHLSDARKIIGSASTFRHRFHQQHYHALKVGLCGIIFLGLVMVFMLPSVVILWGIGCVCVVSCYFFLLRLKFFWPKELLIAVCYTFGIFLGPLSLSQSSLAFSQLMLLPEILLLALANLILFSYFDCETDKQDGHYSLAIHLGMAATRRLVMGLLVAGLIISLIMFFEAGNPAGQYMQILIFCMNGVLLLVLLKQEQFRKHEMYRLLGDGIFYIPALLLLWYAR